MRIRVRLTLAMLLAAGAVSADNAASARYQADGDQLVVTVQYRGTNPDHAFTVRWGPCRRERGEPTVSADLLDSQFRDPARRNFTRTVHLDLQALPCRPARVVLHLEPRFYIDVRVPAAP